MLEAKDIQGTVLGEKIVKVTKPIQGKISSVFFAETKENTFVVKRCEPTKLHTEGEVTQKMHKIFAGDELYVPQIYGFENYGGHDCMILEHIPHARKAVIENFKTTDELEGMYFKRGQFIGQMVAETKNKYQGLGKIKVEGDGVIGENQLQGVHTKSNYKSEIRKNRKDVLPSRLQDFFQEKLEGVSIGDDTYLSHQDLFFHNTLVNGKTNFIDPNPEICSHKSSDLAMIIAYTLNNSQLAQHSKKLFQKLKEGLGTDIDDIYDALIMRMFQRVSSRHDSKTFDGRIGTMIDILKKELSKKEFYKLF